MAKEKKLRAGVIGLGMGGVHVNGYRTHPGVEVVAVADPDQKRLAARGKELAVEKLYGSGEEMLAKEKLDIVSIATPNKFHMPLTLLALEAGCHVLCEKPMAMSAAEGRRMLEAARRAQRRLMINFSFRFTEASWALKRQVEEGQIGAVYYARSFWHRRRGFPGFGGWFSNKELAGGGPLIDLGVHRLDLALWLMGHPKVTWALAGTYNHLGVEQARREGKTYTVEDLAAAFLRFENGASLVLEASWAANIKDNEWMETRLFGTKGGLVQHNIKGGYEFEAELYVERAGSQYDMKLHPPTPAPPSAMHHFAEAILKDQPHIASGEEGLIVMEILDAIYESAGRGEPVRVGAAG